MKLVLANGCFDLFHYGHLRHLKAASAMGDLLFVAITKDRSVNKGPGRPVFTELQREEMLSSIRCVHHVLLVDDVLQALEWLRPKIWALGAEYRGKVHPLHLAFCKQTGIEIAFTDEHVYSSTELLHARS